MVEVCQLLAFRRGADVEAAFLISLGAGGLKVIDLETADYTRAAALVIQYADLPLGAVGACVIAVAGRLRTTEIASLRVNRPAQPGGGRPDGPGAGGRCRAGPATRAAAADRPATHTLAGRPQLCRR